EIPGAKGTSDRGTTVVGTITAPTTGPRTISLNAAGIALVRSWINSPSTNNGILIGNPTVTDGMAFGSKEAPTALNRPKLTVTYGSPSLNFNLSLTNGGNKSVTRGASVSNTISATLVSGTARAVSFSAAGLPTGATAPFSSTACSPTCSTALTLSTTTSTPTGTYPITVTSTGGGVTKTTSFSLTVSSGAPTSSCLQGTGPLLTVSGVKTAQYENQSLAANTRIDASHAQFLTTAWAPVRLGGGSNACFSGGEVIGQLPPSTPWSTMHDVTGMYVTNSSLLHIENTRLFDYGDSLSMASGGLANWSLKGVYAKYMRD